MRTDKRLHPVYKNVKRLETKKGAQYDEDVALLVKNQDVVWDLGKGSYDE